MPGIASNAPAFRGKCAHFQPTAIIQIIDTAPCEPAVRHRCENMPVFVRKVHIWETMNSLMSNQPQHLSSSIETGMADVASANLKTEFNQYANTFSVLGPSKQSTLDSLAMVLGAQHKLQYHTFYKQ